MMTPDELERLASELKVLSDALAARQPAQLPKNRATRIRKQIEAAYEQLLRVVQELDPIRQPPFMFDLSDPNIVGRVVGITMVAQSRKPLAELERFYGSGVYALYYSGDFPAYVPISRREHPIYVGKADPQSTASKTATEQGDRLSGRLSEHRKNIAKAANLRLEDFECRALVIQTGWQTAAENYLIHLFKPIWNSEIGICYGFGKHGDAPETRANLRSPWDTLHPGRDWAHRDPNMHDAKPVEHIERAIAEHLHLNPPVISVDEILRRFLDEMRGAS